ncbi:hypothetical protein M422DRAFT_255932 [Sphaerobolus stellatus SS14]|uniref:Uncharacterized protein n=1 Tax=Sphaerobolus stellatus (strain SS14) TaxID=990650 RepID=A0A0C9VRU9_SPHS4|nr:hypothetical protein M422DRAFT_255932 [Sphaerobolus stellatus SS14]
MLSRLVLERTAWVDEVNMGSISIPNAREFVNKASFDWVRDIHFGGALARVYDCCGYLPPDEFYSLLSRFSHVEELGLGYFAKRNTSMEFMENIPAGIFSMERLSYFCLSWFETSAHFLPNILSKFQMSKLQVLEISRLSTENQSNPDEVLVWLPEWLAGFNPLLKTLSMTRIILPDEGSFRSLLESIPTVSKLIFHQCTIKTGAMHSR